MNSTFLWELEIPFGITFGFTVPVDLNSNYFEPLGKIKYIFDECDRNYPAGPVRIDCYGALIHSILPATQWLEKRGFQVGINILNVGDLSEPEILEIASIANNWPINVIKLVGGL